MKILTLKSLALLTGVAVSLVLTPAVLRQARADEDARTLHVYKTPWCGCCGTWATRMEEAGFKVELTELDDLAPVRKQAGIPEEVAGCHSAAIGGYAIEGHVPAEAIEKLLTEKPRIRGIAVPGMPMGSPGMGDDPNASYDVVTFGPNTTGRSEVFYRAGR